ncbi:MAG: hypothetical protein ACYTF0_02010 [Planctomycetota bacterium]|jgi:hypothetical protein
MTACRVCGEDNPSETKYCRVCGKPMTVAVAFEASKRQHRLLAQAVALDRWARATLVIAGLAVGAIIGGRILLIPATPQLGLAPCDPRPASELLAAEVAMVANENDDLLSVSLTPSLQQWRQRHATTLLATTGGDIDRVRAWQQQLVASQQDDGSFTADDPIAATSLATLALLTIPGDPIIDDAAARAASWLDGKRRATLTGSNHRNRALLAAALLEADRLPSRDLTLTMTVLIDGSAPRWQALALASYCALLPPPDLRLVAKPLTDGPSQWPVLLAGLGLTRSDASLGNSDPLSLEPLDAWAWTTGAWLRGHPSAAYRSALSALTASEPRPLSGDDQADLGPQAGLAMHILACTAPCRLPPGGLDTPR